ncbi:MAG: VCBS repeat-containing protein, partial [Acidimicrobiales bacterium]|nr:VCBS repeat-containing protein [Acidimicrobiales bacterium]
DFDGDGRSDVLWYRPGPGQDYVWYSGGPAGFVSAKVTVRGRYTPFVGDFDGDDRSDVFWWRPGNGPEATWFGLAGRRFASGPPIRA